MKCRDNRIPSLKLDVSGVTLQQTVTFFRHTIYTRNFLVWEVIEVLFRIHRFNPALQRTFSDSRSVYHVSSQFELFESRLTKILEKTCFFLFCLFWFVYTFPWATATYTLHKIVPTGMLWLVKLFIVYLILNLWGNTTSFQLEHVDGILNSIRTKAEDNYYVIVVVSCSTCYIDEHSDNACCSKATSSDEESMYKEKFANIEISQNRSQRNMGQRQLCGMLFSWSLKWHGTGKTLVRS